MLLRKDGELATREANYVDDIHPVTREKDEEAKARQACAQLKSKMNLVGNQADDWKYWLPTVTPGAWNGVIIDSQKVDQIQGRFGLDTLSEQGHR